MKFSCSQNYKVRVFDRNKSMCELQAQRQVCREALKIYNVPAFPIFMGPF